MVDEDLYGVVYSGDTVRVVLPSSLSQALAEASSGDMEVRAHSNAEMLNSLEGFFRSIYIRYYLEFFLANISVCIAINRIIQEKNT